MVFDKAQARECLSKTPIAFIGTMVDVIPGMSTRSMPPTHHYTLRFQNIRLLRGSVSSTEFSYRQRGASGQEEVKEPRTGTTYLACLSDGHDINTLVELDNNTVSDLLQSAKMPLGWSTQSNGQFESPWQHSHAKKVKWHENQRFANIDKCAKTGRPLLVAGDAISFSCQPVQAAHVKEYQNPDGDGVFQLTVTNNSNQSVEVPALLRDPRSGQILWEESVFVITPAGNHFFPGHGQARDVEPTVLQAGESVSTKLDTLTLRDVQWPQGGWRLNLTFCLGDKATEGNYYFFTDHHDPLRVKAEKKNTAIVD